MTNATETMIAKAQAAWDGFPPDWVKELAELADRTSLNSIAKRIGYSPAALSQTIANKYRGDLAGVEEKVRGALMGLNVNCPVLGEIGRHTCLKWQKMPRAVTNSTRSRIYRACRSGCQHSRINKGA